MSQVFSREYLSVPLGGGQTLGTGASLIHTSAAGIIADEIWLYAVNNNASTTRTITLTFANNTIKQSLTANSGLTLVVPGLITSAGQTIYGLIDSGSDVVVYGFVNRITAG